MEKIKKPYFAKLLWVSVNDKNRIPVPTPEKQRIFDTGHEVGELGKEDYSLNVIDMPRAEEVDEFIPSGPEKKEKKRKQWSKREAQNRKSYFEKNIMPSNLEKLLNKLRERLTKNITKTLLLNFYNIMVKRLLKIFTGYWRGSCRIF